MTTAVHIYRTTGALCGSMGGEGLFEHQDLTSVNCQLCRDHLAAGTHANARGEQFPAHMQPSPTLSEILGPTTDTTGAPGASAGQRPSQPAPPILTLLQSAKIVRKDPEHFTERALRTSACWQVLVSQQMAVRKLAAESVYRGDHPIGDVTRFQNELMRTQLQETYARAQLQCSLDWLVSGMDMSSSYEDHTTELWGSQLAARLRKWWLAAFEPAYQKLAEIHTETQNVVDAYEKRVKSTPPPASSEPAHEPHPIEPEPAQQDTSEPTPAPETAPEPTPEPSEAPQDEPR